MSDGSLSQDEIDALLQGSSLDSAGIGAPSEPPALSAKEIKALENLLGEIVISQASNLSGLVGKNVNMKKPVIELVSKDEFLMGLPEEVVEVRSDFQEGLEGIHSYMFTSDIATQVASLMMGQEGVELNEAALSALEEAGNTISGSAATIMGDKTSRNVLTAPVEAKKLKKGMMTLPQGTIVKVSYATDIDGENGSDIIEIFPTSMVKDLIGSAGGGAAPQGKAAAMSQQAQQFAPQQQFSPQQQFTQQGFGGMGGMQQFAQQPMGMPMGGMMAAPNVQPVQFPSLGGPAGHGDQGNISLLMDVYMEMTVELGRTKRLIKDILGMGEGTIIELDKLAGEPVDILVNHKLIAKGEVVVIDENFGVRVTEIVSPMERMSEML